MRIVLDTNVLIAGMLKPFGVCGELVRMLTSGRFTLCVDARILFEYQDVLRRPHFDIDPTMINVIMDYIKNSAEICPAAPLPKALPDPDDSPFLEVAVSGGVDFLVTGNLRHFPSKLRSGIRLISPGEFVCILSEFRKKD